MEYDKLIGKRVYTSPPKLVQDSDAYPIPVLVETIKPSENIAGLIINGTIVVSFPWALKLIKELEG
jgi:hypothetical protein